MTPEGSQVSIGTAPRPVMPSYGDVNRDVLATLRTPGNLYFAWMCIVGLLLTCFFLAFEMVPHAIWAAVMGSNVMFQFLLLWVPVALIGWGMAGAFVGVFLSILRPVRTVVYPPLVRGLGRLLRFCRLHQLAVVIDPAG